VATVMLMCKQS